MDKLEIDNKVVIEVKMGFAHIFYHFIFMIVDLDLNIKLKKFKKQINIGLTIEI